MNAFVFYSPTKVIFGKGVENQVGREIKAWGGTKVLVHFGGGSVKRSGLLDRVEASLKEAGLDYVLLGGAVPNPRLGLVYEGIDLCRKEGIDFVLPVGGGSAIDSAKAIAIGAVYDGDVWDFYDGKAVPTEALPTANILTLAATGSETSEHSVITKEEGGIKRGIGFPVLRPKFTLLNPELLYTLPPYQTACGITDIMMHTLDRYFSKGGCNEMTDRIAEGLLKSVIEAGKAAIENPRDYEARATLMWASSMSHNNLTGNGRDYFMRCHQIEHELSGMYDRVAHGAGLAVVFPAWAKFIYKNEKALPRFCQYANRVWGIDMDFDHPERTARLGIEATENYFKSIGMPVRLRELEVDDSKFEEMAEKCTFFGKRVLRDYIPLGKQEIVEIYRLGL